jgi:methionyl aminopeptidase
MDIIIKKPEQIEGIRKSCALAAETLDFAEQLVNKNWYEMSTGQMDFEIEKFIRDHGAIPAPLNYHGYPASACFSINEVVCHGIPTKETFLQEGDIVNVDITTILDGYYGDTSRMFSIGDVGDKAKKLMSAARVCLDLGITMVQPGNTFADIAKIITDHAREAGYSVVDQFCGHGTGLEFHEPPQINHYYGDPNVDNRRMEPGMIFTIEPMINEGKQKAWIDKKDKWTARTVDGKLSAQYEHTVLVTEEGAEVLTLLQQELPSE